MQLKGGKTLKCPLCSCTSIRKELSEYAFMKNAFGRHGLKEMQAAIPMIVYHCSDCGYIMPFSRNTLRERSASELATGFWVEPKE